MHEFNAGVQLLAKCLRDVPGVKTEIVLNGWPKDEKMFDGADAVVFYMDGGAKHEAVQEGRRRLDADRRLDEEGRRHRLHALRRRGGRRPGGRGIQALDRRALREHVLVQSDLGAASSPSFPDHPITRGVKPFTHQRRVVFQHAVRHAATRATKPQTVAGTKFTPILVAAPSDEVRNGPYVYPKGPYPHIQADKGRAEA